MEKLEYGCIGEHLGHSYSAEIHALLGAYRYRLCELAPGEVAGFLRARNFCGINVTIPYKQAVMPFLDEIDHAACEIGAVNTILCRKGRLIGYNTDFYGMQMLLQRTGIDPCGRVAAVLGTGGTSLTACAVLRAMGAADIVRVSRTPVGNGAPGAETVSYDELLRQRAEIELIVNTTPVGMYPHDEGLPVDPAEFPRLCGITDAVYHPLRTNLVCRGLERGIPSAGGLYMLVAQAAQAAALFLNRPDMVQATDRVFRAIRDRKENIVLIGMPGSGKSTLGRQLAEKTGKVFADSDEIFAARIGVTPADFIMTHGERAFRTEEAAVLRELSAGNGYVIATGGGAVTRSENVRALRRNGKLVWLDRPLCDIRPTTDRPLTRDREALERVYRERMPLYRNAAALHFTVSGTPAEAADKLLAALKYTEEMEE